ncbi:MAG: DUF4013 domain-containing protein [Chloroflexi bacterium]|nr:DUF4013 domain-containing protein [Chloroflexota bacterium]
MNDSVDMGKAFMHLFDDKDWISKTAVGACLSMAPILNFAVVGYELRVVRNVSSGEPQAMPQWDDIGKMFTDGLQLALARWVLALPLTIFICLPLAAFFGFPFIAAIATESAPNADVDRAMGLSFGMGMMLFLLCGGVAAIGSLALGFIYPAMTANFLRHGTFAACFNFPQIVGFIRRNASNYITVWVSAILAGIVYSMAASIVYLIPCLGSVLALPLSAAGVFWIYMVTGHALGQALAFDKPESPS